ncbi:MAG: hypothetical protein ACXW1W_04735 [Methylococcaceae bacterium]
MVKIRMAQSTENTADAAINLWEQLSTQIISIIGEGGFNSLYERSLILTQSTFPWLVTALLPSQTDHRFRLAELKISLEGQAPDQASAANSLLLITFTDILISLIGEQLTTTILRLAWGNDASDSANKELKNE